MSGLVDRLRPGRVAITLAEARRFADCDTDKAKLRGTIDELRRERDELARLAASRLETIRIQIAEKDAAVARAFDLLEQLREARGEEVVADRRPELCRTLAECSSNRAAASRVTRVVAAAPAIDMFGEAS